MRDSIDFLPDRLPERDDSGDMDVLADVLTATRVGGALYCQSRLSAPWGMRFDHADNAGFHVVVRGSCWLRLEGREPVQLGPGDVVLLAHGSSHSLTDSPATPAVPFQEIAACGSRKGAWVDAGGGGAQTVLLCGAYHFEHDGPHPLLSLLPEVVHIPAERAEASGTLQAALHLFRREVGERGPGASTVVTRLIDVLFVYIVRSWLESLPDGRAGWLGALRDAQIGRALAGIHAQPERRWTVESLATQAAMSRAAFARRFLALVGEPPLAYLTRWRMDTAGRLLRDTTRPLSRIAEEVGYESEFAFNKAFRRARGISPGRYRRAAGVVG